MIIDTFDRAAIGSDYVTPGRYGDITGWANGTVDDEVIILEPGVVTQDPARDTYVAGASYVGLGELTDADQFAEITIGYPLRQKTANLHVYHRDYAYYCVYLNAPPIASASSAWTGFRIYTGWYGTNATTTNTYSGSGPIYADLFTVNAAGTGTNSSAPWLVGFSDLGFNDGETELVAGTRMRIELVAGTYYAYLFNPKTKHWTMVFSLTNSIPLADGYPGFSLATAGLGFNDDELRSGSITEFRAGQAVDNDTFLTSNSLTADASAARAASRGLTRSIANRL